MPTNYRPIALLQAFYKFYTLLIDKRLRLVEHCVWRMQVGYKIYRLSGMSRRDVGRIAQDRRQFHQLVERLCSLVDQT